MTGIIGEIAILLGLGRDARVIETRKRKAGRVRRENDTITISTEARRLSHTGLEEGATDDDKIK